MPGTELPVLFTSLQAAHDQGDPYAGNVAERLAQWLDQMNFTVIGYDDEGLPLRQPAVQCTPEQQLRAARFLEYDLRDSIVIAKNNQAKSHTESKASRIARMSGELASLMFVLPPRMGGAELEGYLTGLTTKVCADNPYETSAKLVAIVLRKLREDHFGTYDARHARDVVQHLVASLTGE